MNGEPMILILESLLFYLLVLGAHSLRHRFGLVYFYALLGGLTAVMSWVTDAGVTVEVFNISFMIGSTVFYTALLLGVFVVYVFDGPRDTRIAISTIMGVSVMTPLIAWMLHAQMRLVTAIPLSYIPVPNLRINTASVLVTLTDLLFLAMAWEYLGQPRFRMRLWFRSFITLLGVMWLDVLLFSVGAFGGSPVFFRIFQGTLLSRLIVAIFAFPILYAYIRWQNSRPGVKIESRPILAILQQVAEIRQELNSAKAEIAEKERVEKELEEANNVKKLLLEIITHDLINPLNVIQQMSELVRKEHREDEKIEMIKGASDQLMKVMDNVITLANIALGDTVEMGPVDLVQEIQNLSKEFKIPLKNKGLELDIHLPDSLVIEGNPIIAEVFKNYLSNAIKYAADGRRIVIDSQAGNGELTLRVKDFGTTIPANLRRKIFNRSFQISQHKTGRGLGLSIVKKIASAHRAEVGVKTNHPQGNIFYITFPERIRQSVERNKM